MNLSTKKTRYKQENKKRKIEDNEEEEKQKQKKTKGEKLSAAAKEYEKCKSEYILFQDVIELDHKRCGVDVFVQRVEKLIKNRVFIEDAYSPWFAECVFHTIMIKPRLLKSFYFFYQERMKSLYSTFRQPCRQTREGHLNDGLIKDARNIRKLLKSCGILVPELELEKQDFASVDGDESAGDLLKCIKKTKKVYGTAAYEMDLKKLQEEGGGYDVELELEHTPSNKLEAVFKEFSKSVPVFFGLHQTVLQTEALYPLLVEKEISNIQFYSRLRGVTAIEEDDPKPSQCVVPFGEDDARSMFEAFFNTKKAMNEQKKTIICEVTHMTKDICGLVMLFFSERDVVDKKKKKSCLHELKEPKIARPLEVVNKK